jgi:UDP-N-acetylmuramyl pentapeptide phosphotransferase/UDP-N-acetylglucosamine-1-phosphate transferase
MPQRLPDGPLAAETLMRQLAAGRMPGHGRRVLKSSVFLLGLFLVSALVSAVLCVLLRPLLVRYAMARPGARSSHTVPTPQGGGIAILLGILASVAIPLALFGTNPFLVAALGCMLALALLGAWDDMRPLPALRRLLVQAACVIGLVGLVPVPPQILAGLVPLPVEIGLVVIAGVWFVNLTNFMDGLDWITVAGLLPMGIALGLLGLVGGVPPHIAILATAMAGALIGFAPFNKPVAKLFMGDVGSLPLGLLMFFLLWQLAGSDGLAAAILLPLYHVSDATITLLRRLWRRERVWEAHRSHFYQRATDNGLTVMQVVGHVFALNLALAVLAAGSLYWPGLGTQTALVLTGIGLTSAVLWRFSRKPAV